TYPAEELERMRLQRLAGLKQAKADAGFLADMVFSKLVFGGHPYGQQPSGTEKSVGLLDRQSIVEYASEYLTPNNSFLVAAGDISPDGLATLLDRELAEWKSKGRKAQIIVNRELLAGRQVGLINREGAV